MNKQNENTRGEAGTCCTDTMRFTISLVIIIDIATALLERRIFLATDVAQDELDSWLLHMGNKRVCYHDLGCFDLGKPWFTWTRPVPVLPQPAEEIDTKFFLVTRENQQPEFLHTRPVIDVSGSSFKRVPWLFYIVHGFMGHHDDEWVLSLARQLLRLLDANVILVDWSNGSNMLNYIQAIANARLVGAEMARFTLQLTQQGLSDPSKTHALGYSLGAQVVGYMANNVTGLHRITAFDPAQPGFEGTDPLVHLDASDAEFVDVIHTNGVPFLPELGLGMRSSVGHVDFFINGGETQPGCRQRIGGNSQLHDNRKIYKLVQKYFERYSQITIKVDTIEEVQSLLEMDQDNKDPLLLPAPSYFNLFEFLMGKVASIVEYLVCSHELAPKYYIEALEYSNCTFWAVPWAPYKYSNNTENCTPSTCSEMGLHAILYLARGNFYVETAPQTPFCIWKPKIDSLMKNGLADELLKLKHECKNKNAISN